MRLILQRVLSAALKFNGSVVTAIGRGLLVLVTFNKGDTKADAEWMAQKALRARLWSNPKSAKKWDSSVMQNKFEVLVVPQPYMASDVPETELPLDDPKLEEELFAVYVAKSQKTYPGPSHKAATFGQPVGIDMMGDGPVTMVLHSNMGTEGDEGEEKKSAPKPKKK